MKKTTLSLLLLIFATSTTLSEEKIQPTPSVDACNKIAERALFEAESAMKSTWSYPQVSARQMSA